jgi:hypothetical protein
MNRTPAPCATPDHVREPSAGTDDVQLLNVWWDVLMAMNPQAWPGSDPQSAFLAGYRALQETDPDAVRRFQRGKRGELRRVLFGCESRSGAYELAEAELVGSVLEGMGLVRTVGPRPADVRDAETGRPVMTRLREVARLRDPWDTDDVRQWLRDSWPAIMSLSIAELKLSIRAMRTAGA